MVLVILVLAFVSLMVVIGVRLNRRAFLVGWGVPTALALAAEVIDSLTRPESTGGFAAAGEAFGFVLFLFVALLLAPIIGCVCASIVSRRTLRRG
jgi:uncharacterized protein YqgC (DUF456 family)